MTLSFGSKTLLDTQFHTTFDMYEYKNITYAEAGYILEANRVIGMWLSSSLAPFTERLLNLDNLTVTDAAISFDIFHWQNPGIRTYADAKKFIINKRYTNDDQIAIILNKDDDEESALAFQKMQEWREWASVVARKIMETIESSNETDR